MAPVPGATFARSARRIAGIATALLIASTLYGVWYVLAIFWNDGGTHVAAALAVVAVAIAALARARRVAWLAAVPFAVGIALATHLAARHPIDYYDDSLRAGATAPGVYRWIATTHPPAVGGWGLRLGVVNVLSPATRTVDLSDTGSCAQARRDDVLLVAVAQNDVPYKVGEARLREARACGKLLYGDETAVVSRP